MYKNKLTAPLSVPITLSQLRQCGQIAKCDRASPSKVNGFVLELDNNGCFIIFVLCIYVNYLLSLTSTCIYIYFFFCFML